MKELWSIVLTIIYGVTLTIFTLITVFPMAIIIAILHISGWKHFRS